MNRNVVFKGSLNFLALPELVQFIGTTGGTGVLRLTTPYSRVTGTVYFLRGTPVNAFNGSLAGLDALYSMFGWKKGEFDFSREKINVDTTIHMGQMEIVLNGLRMLDEGTIKGSGTAPLKKKEPGIFDTNSNLPLITNPITHYSLMVAEEEFFEGHRIIEEGEYGSWIWIVLNGVAEISKKTLKGPAKILKAGQGTFAGNTSSIFRGGYRRIVTITASSKVQLGVLDTQPLHEEYSRLSAEFRKILFSLDNRFREVSERLADISSKTTKLEDFIDGRHMITKLDKSTEEAFIIERGSASVLRNRENGYLPLAHLNKDDFFGQIPFLDISHEPHSSSVFVSKDLKATALDLEGLQKEYEQLSKTFRSIIKFTVNCISIATLTACELHSQTNETNPGKIKSCEYRKDSH
ncbi:MAG: DUF4388 domain-containing protein [Desulfobacteraceae bacterium]|nr:DUF4388 domain-containing protein [Desulfobacteraceae bacterium]